MRESHRFSITHAITSAPPPCAFHEKNKRMHVNPSPESPSDRPVPASPPLRSSPLPYHSRRNKRREEKRKEKKSFIHGGRCGDARRAVPRLSHRLGENAQENAYTNEAFGKRESRLKQQRAAGQTSQPSCCGRAMTKSGRLEAEGNGNIPIPPSLSEWVTRRHSSFAICRLPFPRRTHIHPVNFQFPADLDLHTLDVTH
jgi:hypothetical protein